jgi:hypothetical protein
VKMFTTKTISDLDINDVSKFWYFFITKQYFEVVYSFFNKIPFRSIIYKFNF